MSLPRALEPGRALIVFSWLISESSGGTQKPGLGHIRQYVSLSILAGFLSTCKPLQKSSDRTQAEHSKPHAPFCRGKGDRIEDGTHEIKLGVEDNCWGANATVIMNPVPTAPCRPGPPPSPSLHALITVRGCRPAPLFCSR